MTQSLETAMARAQATGDWAEVIALYTQAADAAPDPGASAFYLTHAYVHALEAGSDQAPRLHARLLALGADTPNTQS